MMNYKISVIVPIYNVEQYLHQCIDSIIGQSFNNLEIILVNDGSTDKSGDICEEYAKVDSRIKIIKKENGGLTSARRAGIEKATGDYVVVVDGDDWIDKQTIQSCVAVICNNSNVDLVLFSYTKEYPNRSIKNQTFSEDKDFSIQSEFQTGVYRRLFGLTNSELEYPEKLDYLTTLWGKMYRRELALSGKYVDTQEVGSGEDGIFNLDALQACKQAVYINKPFYHYRKNDSSLTSKYRPKLPDQWELLFNMMQNKIDECHFGLDYQEALNNRIALSVLGIGMNKLSDSNVSFFHFASFIKKYINTEKYRASVTTMKLRNLPIAWKLLMFCCKYRFPFFVALILELVKLLKSKL